MRENCSMVRLDREQDQRAAHDQTIISDKGVGAIASGRQEPGPARGQLKLGLISAINATGGLQA